MTEIRNKIMSLFGRRGQETQIGKIVPVSLAEYINVQPEEKKSILARYLFSFSKLSFFLWLTLMTIVVNIYRTVGIVGLSFTILIAIIMLYFAKNRLRKKKRELPAYSRTLLSFINDNNLFERDSTGYITSEISMYYAEYPKEFAVFIRKKGDKYQKHAATLGELLESRLGMNLVDVKENSVSVEYSFQYCKAQRKVISDMPKEDTSLNIAIYDDFKVSLRDNYSMLVSGSSGAGKSFFTYQYLSSFISQKVGEKHARLYGIDPKQSDLFTLFRQSKFPTENYGTSVADAFRIVRAYTAEMNKRIEAYSKSGMFNSVAIDLGFPPALLVIEEYSSLVATMETKQRKEFENLVAVLAQKSRQLSMGLLIIMQQPRADSLGTNVREQLQNAVFLGNPSKESSQMMFGTTDVPTVSGTGVGLYSIERSTPRVFESPMFDGNVFEIILPVWRHVAESYEAEKVWNKYEFDESQEELSAMPDETEELAIIADDDWNDYL